MVILSGDNPQTFFDSFLSNILNSSTSNPVYIFVIFFSYFPSCFSGIAFKTPCAILIILSEYLKPNCASLLYETSDLIYHTIFFLNSLPANTEYNKALKLFTYITSILLVYIYLITFKLYNNIWNTTIIFSKIEYESAFPPKTLAFFPKVITSVLTPFCCMPSLNLPSFVVITL